MSSQTITKTLVALSPPNIPSGTGNCPALACASGPPAPCPSLSCTGPAPAGRPRSAAILERVRAKWRKRIADEITDDDVAELLEETALTAPVGANRTQSVLHTLFSWAKEPGRKHVKSNPVADMKRRHQETPRERVLTDAEIKALWWGLDDPDLPTSKPVALALKFILATMVRPGQSAGARMTQ